ncbi:RnfABCDGE type electron transport complex subunit D [Paenibacillus roseipurpureus]|uniref:RnfABCDGE type electron transport complex subunit D n=1 Tax=Paenibacillus roseopurpureus TaxID=2918901 RepID=A0AA96RIQ5_9BACL|nr:RnfABCDGE type electron transport complex subunit D [Paenibacillus sp. MBLB1832]WNR42499.1 RnfABCDGE type electron transport complex subunit D [Paenibacillus sp. MBLB1832]
MSKWVKTPKGYLVSVMLVCLFSAAFFLQDIKGIEHAGVAVATAVATDLLFVLFQKRKRKLPDGAIITGLLIALILSSTTSWTIVAATSVIAILSKKWLVINKKPIFNPAAFGLLASVIIFHTGQSWWGSFADLSSWLLVLLGIGGYVITDRVNKFPQVFSYLAIYLGCLLIFGYFHIGDAVDALRAPFIQAALFFAFFMLTDPPTSPAKTKDQIIFGMITALVGAMIYAIFGGLMYLFIGLLVGNGYFYLKSKVRLHSNIGNNVKGRGSLQG